MHYPLPLRSQVSVAVLAMGLVVLSSNILVQFAINDWLTWGAITYPFAFLVTELVNRAFGPAQARRVAWFGFAVACGAGPRAHCSGLRAGLFAVANAGHHRV